jgi:hypothetical protein
MPMIFSVVEGYGEVKTVPLLLRRIAQEQQKVIFAPQSMRISRGRIKDELERILKFASIEFRTKNQIGAVLIVLDADDDCPAELGILLREKARQIRSDMQVVIAVANREFEAWYLAGIESLAGKHGISSTVKPPPDPEGIRDAKGWLGSQMGSYSPTVHQEKFAAILDLRLARASQSFARFYDRVSELIQQFPDEFTFEEL